jgi:dihydrofolate reductase
VRKIVVVNFMSLDGVMQGPGHPDEDRSGGFDHGGWVMPYIDEEWGKVFAEGSATTDALLFGRKTYEIMAAHWPHQPDDDPIAAMMNGTQKYVVSNTLTEVTWENSSLITGDVVAGLTELKEGPGKNITVLGSGELLRTLMTHGLVDEYVVALYPLVLGYGKRLFRDGLPRIPLALAATRPTTTGGVILTYRPSAADDGASTSGG